MKKKYLFFGLCVFFVFASLSGCGYTCRSNLAEHLKTVYVENVKNTISFTEERERYSAYFPGLENNITKSLENRFVFEGSLKLSNNKQFSDLILSGDLTSYVRQPLRYESDEVEEYRLSVTLKCVLFDSVKNKILWEESIIGDSTYFVTGSLSKTESEALDEAIEDLARRVVEKTVIQW